ncbi:dihydroorotase [Mangrovibacillus cuniculi]|nr:dihydroorotase [Mangrovibacillus cuniculi]
MILKNGLIWTENRWVKSDLKIDEGKIAVISSSITPEEREEVMDANGNLVIPGLIDLHVHLREPGFTEKETIKTGTEAAVRGGFTTIACMPNTKPVIDNVETLHYLQERIREESRCHVLPYAALTTRLAGKELTNFEELTKLGAFAFTDDGVGLQTASTMYEAMKKAKLVGKAVVAHCEDMSLVKGGAMHEGEKSRELGIPGILSISESVQIARDVLLAEATGVHYHVCHVSTKESVRIIRDAKKAGIHVTAEVSPHHLLLTEDDIKKNDANWKMNPPLRSKEDRAALREGLLDGTIDFIATDHAPHTPEEKQEGFERSPFGIVGLETAFSILYTKLVTDEGFCTLEELLHWLTVAPSNAFSLGKGVIKEGEIADITIIDLQKEENIDASTFASKGRNTPFHGWNVKGLPIVTIVNGEVKWNKGGVAVC